MPSVWLWFSFRQLLLPAYTSRYLQAPCGVVGVIYRDFNLLRRSLLKRFPLFIWLLFALSSVPSFRPDTGWRRWTLVQVASSLALRGGRGVAFPIYAAQAPGCSIWSMPCAARGSRPWVLHKSAGSAAPVLCLPGLSSSGSQEFVGHALPGAAPSPLRIPSPSPRPRR